MLLWVLTTALAGECKTVSMADVLANPAEVVVLGERKGTWPDLARAKKVVQGLLKRGPVTLALQAVDASKQEELDAFAAGKIPSETLGVQLDWSENWGFPLQSYLGLLQIEGVDLVAAGHAFGPVPEGEIVQRSPGYLNVLLPTMGEVPIPVEWETSFVSRVSYLDASIARSAYEGWDAKGTLVVVADRFHVEGGAGIPFQLGRLHGGDVQTLILAAGDGCAAGDRALP